MKRVPGHGPGAAGSPKPGSAGSPKPGSSGAPKSPTKAPGTPSAKGAKGTNEPKANLGQKRDLAKMALAAAMVRPPVEDMLVRFAQRLGARQARVHKSILYSD